VKDSTWEPEAYLTNVEHLLQAFTAQVCNGHIPVLIVQQESKRKVVRNRSAPKTKATPKTKPRPSKATPKTAPKPKSTPQKTTVEKAAKVTPKKETKRVSTASPNHKTPTPKKPASTKRKRSPSIEEVAPKTKRISIFPFSVLPSFLLSLSHKDQRSAAEAVIAVLEVSKVPTAVVPATAATLMPAASTRRMTNSLLSPLQRPSTR
jgi:hypothetical protein